MVFWSRTSPRLKPRQTERQTDRETDRQTSVWLLSSCLHVTLPLSVCLLVCLRFRSNSNSHQNFISISGCPKLRTSSQTTVTPETPVYHFGTKVTLSCLHGYAFPAEMHRDHSVPRSSVVLECLQGGVWNMTEIPVCKGESPSWCFGASMCVKWCMIVFIWETVSTVLMFMQAYLFIWL